MCGFLCVCMQFYVMGFGLFGGVAMAGTFFNFRFIYIYIFCFSLYWLAVSFKIKQVLSL